MQPGYKKRSKTQWQLIHRKEFQQWVANSFGKNTITNDPDNVCPLAPHQHIVKDFLTDSPYRGLVLYHGLGVGKCHAKDTRVVMYDGSVKVVQDVRERDVLLGDDGGPRTVLSLARGRDKMYRVDQHNAEPYTCNQEHILCLKRVGDLGNVEDRIVEIPIKSFVTLSLKDQVALKGYATDVMTFSTAVAFPYPYLHPYIVGYWLADNMSMSVENSVAHICCRTNRIIKYINQLCTSSSLELIHRGLNCYAIVDQRNNNAFDGLRKQFIDARGVPNTYKVASPQSRQHFLAGVIDRFGRIQDGCVVLEDASSQCLLDIQFIARSLGIRCAVQANQQLKTSVVKLFGPRLRELPLSAPYINNQMHLVDRDDVLSNITLCELGEDEYYGFVLDGNSRYVLHDFTVTHNTRAAVAIAETLSASHKIHVLVPASLESNFVSEILLCGNNEYQYSGVWSFHSKDAADYANVKTAGLVTGVKETTLRKNRGIWVRTASSNTSTHNFEQLTDAQRQQIGAQIKDMVQFRYSFLHYNGLNANQLSVLTRDDTVNPFDGSIVIIDEVHNLISRIVNKSAIAGKLVQLLMTARGAKVLMLSGTPIINRPVELAHICNLARGPLSYVVAFATGALLPRLEEALRSSQLVDYYEVDSTTASIMIVPLPFGFQWDNKDGSRQSVVRSGDKNKVSDIKSFKAYLESILKLDEPALSIRSSMLLPTDEETFDDIFIDYAHDAIIKNSMLLARRLQGIVSHYAQYDKALFPTVSDINYVHVDMSASMLKKYLEVREDEIKKEISSSQTSSTSSRSKNELTSGSVYRSYSRAVCNFTFPPTIKRPYPSTMKHWKFETVSIDDDEAATSEQGNDKDKDNNKNATDVKTEEPATTAKSSSKDDYAVAVEKAMQRLGADKGKFLTGKSLDAYGPKFAACIERIGASPGSTVVYSQFRSVEGLGVMELVLQAHGYKKLAVARDKTTNDWHFTNKMEFDRPHYCVFTSDDREQNEIVLNIMNNNLVALPRSLRDQLSVAWKKHHDRQSDMTNLHGELVKVLMITQSGAEGISLKNVRQVHIIEPYWNAIRIEQVIGRAVRAGSHLELPEAERHVDVYMYITKFTEVQMKEQVVSDRERGLTSDEYILGIAQRKTRLTNAFLKLMKRSAIDCLVHAADRKECTTFPANFGSPPGVMYSYKGIGDDTKDAVLKQQVKQVTVSQTIGFVRCGRTKYPFRRDTMELLDPNAFDSDTKTQVVIGRVMVDPNTRKPNLVLYDAGPLELERNVAPQRQIANATNSSNPTSNTNMVFNSANNTASSVNASSNSKINANSNTNTNSKSNNAQTLPTTASNAAAA